jgi:hypothetical protein
MVAPSPNGADAMTTHTERTDNTWMRIRSVAAGFLCVMGLPVALALADVHSPTAEKPAAAVQIEESVHFAQAQFDVGPGSDEALVAALPVAR